MPSLMDVDMPPPARNFWVELPSLEPGSRSNPNLHYISGSQLKDDSSSVASDTDESSQAKSKDQDGDDGAIDLDDLQLQEIVGEYEWPGGAKYYYARLRSEEIRKFRFAVLEEYFPELVEEYRDLKATDQLEPFDPSGIEVRPKDRVPTTPVKGVRASTRNISRGYSASSLSTLPDDERDASGVETDSDTSSEDSDNSSERPIRITRATRNSRASIPQLSPRKHRTRAVSNRFKAHDPDDSDFNQSSDSEASSSEIEIIESKKPAKPRRNESRVPLDRGLVMSFDDFENESNGPEGPLHTHTPTCVKCGLLPAHLIPKRRGKKKSEEFEMDEEERRTSMGGWVACLHCCRASHFGCLPTKDRDELVRGIRRRENAVANENDAEPSRRKTLDIGEATAFVCIPCSRLGTCTGCQAAVPVPAAPKPPAGADVFLVDESDIASEAAPQASKPATNNPLLFRCTTCLRPAHYEHLPPLQMDEDEELSASDIAKEYHTFGWNCKDCHSWTGKLDKILAWRPISNAVEEPKLAPGEVPNVNDPLQRQYLVKWENKSYRRVEWVPHQFLLARFKSRLTNFLKGGSSIRLLNIDADEVVRRLQEREISGALTSPGRAARLETINSSDEYSHTPDADPIAELRIPEAWRTVDRILDVRFLRPAPKPKKTATKPTKATRHTVIQSDEEEDGEPEKVDGENDDPDKARRASLVDGVEPAEHLCETWAQRSKRGKITEKDAEDAVWAYMKWQDLTHEESTWDTPTIDGAGFQEAFAKLIAAKLVVVPELTQQEAAKRDNRTKHQITKYLDQPSWQPNHLKLKDFQLDGLTWLYDNWHNHQPSILADEMGLGKTVQIATFIGVLVKDKNVFPHLIVVPNSTITNWVRELEAWAPGVRVVQYNGSAASRKIIRDYEMYTETGRLNYHVLLTTYEMVSSASKAGSRAPSDFGQVFNKVSRWEVLIVDEGQRLKADSSLLFDRLTKLNAVHRILMTGTPINNNIREVFNLMNYLDPENWDDLDGLESRYEVLTQELVTELHERLRPYFLRRVKSEVMQDLPRKHEVIVPLSMTKLQAEVWKSIITRNGDLLRTLAQGASMAKSGAKLMAKTNLNNTLMEIRKCMQHPYLTNPMLEPRHLPNKELHQNLIDASSKLRFLTMMLPKLKARGHRVLLFSQFVIALDIIEDFLQGEGYKFLRLDGNTPQVQRQKDMDAFNRPDSEYFIFILSTRAGGVGINLWSADTVIINDVDFNPHQDLQAIARAHRMGQTKPVLVFTLMIKSTAEEKIIQNGKKKLVLDHLIVQKMDEEDSLEDVQSILSFGAKALFEDDSQIDTTYSSEEVDSLIERVERQATEPEEPQAQTGMTFGFAKVWEKDKANLEEVGDALEPSLAEQKDPKDFWAGVMERHRLEEQAKLGEVTSGRGVRRKATRAVYTEQSNVELAGPAGEDSDYEDPDIPPGDDDDNSQGDLEPLSPVELPDPVEPHVESSQPKAKRKHPSKKLYPDDGLVPSPGTLGQQRPDPYRLLDGEDIRNCFICLTSHRPGDCSLIQNPSVLEQARRAILDSGNHEPIQVREAALQAIYDVRLKLQQSVVKRKPKQVDPHGQQYPMKKARTSDESLNVKDAAHVPSSSSRYLKTSRPPQPFPMDISNPQRPTNERPILPTSTINIPSLPPSMGYPQNSLSVREGQNSQHSVTAADIMDNLASANKPNGHSSVTRPQQLASLVPKPVKCNLCLGDLHSLHDCPMMVLKHEGYIQARIAEIKATTKGSLEDAILVGQLRKALESSSSSQGARIISGRSPADGSSSQRLSAETQGQALHSAVPTRPSPKPISSSISTEARPNSSRQSQAVGPRQPQVVELSDDEM